MITHSAEFSVPLEHNPEGTSSKYAWDVDLSREDSSKIMSFFYCLSMLVYRNTQRDISSKEHLLIIKSKRFEIS